MMLFSQASFHSNRLHLYSQLNSNTCSANNNVRHNQCMLLGSFWHCTYCSLRLSRSESRFLRNIFTSGVAMTVNAIRAALHLISYRNQIVYPYTLCSPYHWAMKWRVYFYPHPFYTSTMNCCMRYRLLFSLLRSSIQGIRGARFTASKASKSASPSNWLGDHSLVTHWLLHDHWTLNIWTSNLHIELTRK